MTASLLARLYAAEGGEENGMDDKTLTALKGSIAKWEAIIAGAGKDDGPANCPLCKNFWERECIGCPVAAKTGHQDCGGSPYDKWLVLHTKAKPGEAVRAETPEQVAAAQAELDFLKSLLPSKPKDPQ